MLLHAVLSLGLEVMCIYCNCVESRFVFELACSLLLLLKCLICEKSAITICERTTILE